MARASTGCLGDKDVEFDQVGRPVAGEFIIHGSVTARPALKPVVESR